MKTLTMVSRATPTITDRVLAVRYLRASASSWWLAENIGWGSGRLGTPAGMVRQWMNSPPHRVNIMNGAYSAAGVGMAYSSDGQIWVCVDFGG